MLSVFNQTVKNKILRKVVNAPTFVRKDIIHFDSIFGQSHKLWKQFEVQYLRRHCVLMPNKCLRFIRLYNINSSMVVKDHFSFFFGMRTLHPLAKGGESHLNALRGRNTKFEIVFFSGCLFIYCLFWLTPSSPCLCHRY